MSEPFSIPLEQMRRMVKPTPKGRPLDPVAVEEVQALLGRMPRRPDLLIECLHLLQDTYRAVHARHLAALAAELKMSQAEVYEVATFYHHFDVLREGEGAPAELTVRVCDTLSCKMAGADDLLKKLPGILGTRVRVIPAPCVGRCEQAPVVVVGQNALGGATEADVKAAVKANESTHPLPRYVGYKAYLKAGGYQLFRDLVEGRRDVESVIQAMEHSGLRGLGGAGFPAGRKWRIVRAEAAPRLMAINIDEGEPGTFKDRWYLERDPHRFLEGMLIAAYCVGIGEVYVYLRDEYAHVRDILQKELKKLLAAPPCALPPIHLRRGAGAYICGEESAMIESIEGKRGMPRLRPPYVAQVGLFGHPTLEHNMETVFWIRDIVEKGADWFA
ncbi:MAG: NAD(P)H-dependent oxidoreductase subunit E, partial [Methyloversatilis sp.]